MQLTPVTFLIVCPLVFLAGLVDSIGGGGGLISLPAYMIAGVPAHMAIATNKLSSCCGTALATGRFIRNRMVDLKTALPSVVAAVVGSWLGAKCSMAVSETVIRNVMLVILPVTAFLVLNPRLFSRPDTEQRAEVTLRLCLIMVAAGLVIGFYDGFYGPGTGTFLIIAFRIFAGMGTRQANGQAKAVNLTTNVTSLAVFLMNGQVLLPLGLAAAACNMAGAWIGSGLVMKQGSRIVRPCIILVLILLALKVLGVF